MTIRMKKYLVISMCIIIAAVAIALGVSYFIDTSPQEYGGTLVEHTVRNYIHL